MIAREGLFRLGTGRRRVVGRDIDETESVALDLLSASHADGGGEHRARITERVELAFLAAGVDLRGKVGEKVGVELAAHE